MKLDLDSKIDNTQYPFTNKWDVAYRQNFSKYQELIDQLTYSLQRSQKGFFIFGETMYPNFHQKKLLSLDLYQKKQILGQVFQNEIDDFKNVNPNIANDFNNTFNSKMRVPTYGIGLGTVSLGVSHYLNLQYSFRMGLFLIPIAANVLNNTLQIESYFKTKEFLDWTYQTRLAKARIEMKEKQFVEISKKYQQLYSNDKRPLKVRFNQLVDLVQTEK